MISPPDIKRYSSYRDFLRDFHAHRKSLRKSFSYRLFAKKAGLASPNYLQLVIAGKKNLSAALAVRVARAMGLAPAEGEYFVALVRAESAGSPDEARAAERASRVAIRRLVSTRIRDAQIEVLSRWYHLVVRELAFLPEFLPSGTWISERLRGLVSPEQAEESLTLLRDAGFFETTAGGNLVPKDPVIDTGDSSGEARVLRTHSETLAAWISVLGQLPQEERELGLLNIPISSAKLPELKRRIRAFQDELIGWLQDEKSPDRVVQLGTYLIPISRPPGG